MAIAPVHAPPGHEHAEEIVAEPVGDGRDALPGGLVTVGEVGRRGGRRVAPRSRVRRTRVGGAAGEAEPAMRRPLMPVPPAVREGAGWVVGDVGGEGLELPPRQRADPVGPVHLHKCRPRRHDPVADDAPHAPLARRDARRGVAGGRLTGHGLVDRRLTGVERRHHLRERFGRGGAEGAALENPEQELRLAGAGQPALADHAVGHGVVGHEPGGGTGKARRAPGVDAEVLHRVDQVDVPAQRGPRQEVLHDGDRRVAGLVDREAAAEVRGERAHVGGIDRHPVPAPVEGPAAARGPLAQREPRLARDDLHEPLELAEQLGGGGFGAGGGGDAVRPGVHAASPTVRRVVLTAWRSAPGATRWT